jgi:ligand-binding SRPBCC domain-containing protein
VRSDWSGWSPYLNGLFSFCCTLRIVRVHQLRGPYRLWHHTHEFEPDGDRTVVRDRVDYALPFGPLGEVAHRVVVANDLRRIFDYRREVVGRLLG